MSETSPAEFVSDGFSDELLKLGFDRQLERFAVLSIEKSAAAPAPGAFRKLWSGIKSTPVGKTTVGAIGKNVFRLLTPAFAIATGVGAARATSRSGLQKHKQKMFSGMHR